MRRGQALLLTILAAAGAASCSSKSGSATPAEPPEPPLLGVSQDASDFDLLVLSWSATSGASGYTIEGRILPGAWEAVGTAPGSVTAVSLALAPTVPEIVDFEFRVTARRGRTDYPSNVAAYHRGLRPPTGLTAWQEPGGFRTQWMNHSLAADGWALERRVAFPDGSTQPFVALPVVFPNDSFLDGDLSAFTDGARYQYRLAAVRGAERSASVEGSTGTAALLAPDFLSAASIPGGVRLSFRNRSAWATELAIFRSSGPYGGMENVQVVLASATGHDDLAPAPGLYAYQVVARRPSPGWSPLTSDPVTLRAVANPPASWGVSASLVPGVPAEVAARAPDGTFAFAGGLGGHPFSGNWYLAAGAPPADVVQEAEGSRTFAPSVLVDGAGVTHVLFAAGPASWVDPVPIVHAWYDGSTWQREEIAHRVLSPGDATQVLRLARGADGTLHASWQAGPDAAMGLEVASLGSGGWALENVSLALGTPGQVRWRDHYLAGDATGQPHLIVSDWDGSLKHLWRESSAWSLETVPTGITVAMLSGDYYPFSFLAAADRLAIVFQDEGSYPEVPAAHVLERTASGWGARLDLPAPPGGVGAFAAALSADGTRLAVASKSGGAAEGRVHVREAAGGTTELRFFTTAGGLATGFASGGKVWVLDGIAGTGVTPADAVTFPLFEEL